MKKSTLKQIIKEEIDKVLNEAMAPAFRAEHENNNLVAAIYFSWNKAENNNPSFWSNVVQIIEQEDCRLLNYVVTTVFVSLNFVQMDH